jgi:hypothetical protein
MVAAIKGGRLEDIDPYHCREYVHEHFSVAAMLDGYEAAFEEIVVNSRPPRIRENAVLRSN